MSARMMNLLAFCLIWLKFLSFFRSPLPRLELRRQRGRGESRTSVALSVRLGLEVGMAGGAGVVKQTRAEQLVTRQTCYVW